jgi:enamine deaminase RidA (YjgF/YER057c/UK114 family)
MMPPILSLRHKPPLHQATLARGGFIEQRITIAADASDPLRMFSEVVDTARTGGATVCAQLVLGGTRFRPDAEARMGRPQWPVTWLQGDPCNGEHLSASQVVAVSGVAVRPVVLKGRVVGKVFRTPCAIVCRLGNVLPDDLGADRAVQARQVFENLEAALGSAGLAFTDVVRTWLYLGRLLEWYGPFNEVRTRFFEERGVFEHLVPASTGIGAANPAGAALVADALAIRPMGPEVRVSAVPSPLQCPAPAYRSSFSRAVEVQWPEGRELLISGTASIAPDGRSAHPGDTRRQIALTMEVIEAILASRGMTWGDSARGIAYFKDLREAPLLAEYGRHKGLPPLPLALSHADVCRPDLLFELELDAAASTPPPTRSRRDCTTGT